MNWIELGPSNYSLSILTACGLRYFHMSSGKGYGNAVWRHLNAVKTALSQEEPKRSPWLRLLKDISDYVKVARSAEKKISE